ncbi:MAG: hypothetical protein ACLFNW_12450, partial [Desulfobacterales bacterium]
RNAAYLIVREIPQGCSATQILDFLRSHQHLIYVKKYNIAQRQPSFFFSCSSLHLKTQIQILIVFCHIRYIKLHLQNLILQLKEAR